MPAKKKQDSKETKRKRAANKSTSIEAVSDSLGLRKVIGGLKSSDLPFLDAFISQIYKHKGSPKQLQITPNLKSRLP